MTDDANRALLEAMFRAAVQAADPGHGLARALPEMPARGKVLVLGAGKASARMAEALEQAWAGLPGDRLSGLVVVPHGTLSSCRRIRRAEAAHPVPDAAGLEATKDLLALTQGLTAEDLVIALISGGGSSLLPAPAPGLTLEDEQALNAELLRSGAAIGEMNLIRNQISRVKGGRLALACAPARVVTMVVSDVPGDDPAVVASGPTLPGALDPQASRAEARRLVALYGVDLPPAVARLIASEDNLPPGPQDPAFAGNAVHVLASASTSLAAAATLAEQAGLAVHILSDGIEGEASAIGQMHAALAREVATRDRPFARPCVLLSGGETTVTLRRTDGAGGRNTEFLLAFALGIAGLAGITALTADTDGIDGRGAKGQPAPAGAFADGSSIARMRERGLDPAAALRANDSATVFQAIGDLFTTGPTGTNVNDFRAILLR